MRHYKQSPLVANHSINTHLALSHTIMSFSSSRNSTPSTSPSTSVSMPRSIQIGFSPAGTRAAVDIYTSSKSQSSKYSTCAYPSWPCGRVLEKATDRRPSAYISDEDLFGDDTAPYMISPPAPPRPAEAHWAMAQPLLPSVTTARRRSSGYSQRKHRKSSTSSTQT